MGKVEDAWQTMVANYPAKTGRSLDAWVTLVREQDLTAHGTIVAWLKTEHGMGHGFANGVAAIALAADEAPDDTALVDAQYAGAKAPLRPICDALVGAARALGSDVEVAVKKTGISLRRSRQFALVEAPSAKRVELGLNLRGREPAGRLEVARGMCTHRVRLASMQEIDAEVLGWLRDAWAEA